MKNKVFLVIVLLLLMPMLLWAAMTEPQALKKARTLWGPLGNIGSTFGISTWTRQVGVNSPGCDVKFSVLGEGPGTWEAAFANYDAKLVTEAIKIHGPFGGTLSLSSLDMNPPVVVAIKIFIDGVQQGPETPPTATFMVDTTGLTNGIHVLCIGVRGNNGAVDYVGGSPVYLFSVSQAAGTAPNIAMAMKVFSGMGVYKMSDMPVAIGRTMEEVMKNVPQTPTNVP